MKLLSMAAIAATIMGAAAVAIAGPSVSTQREVISEESVDCAACNGTGKQKTAAGSVTCNKCKGTGKVAK